MPITNLFSKRQKLQNGNIPDILTYDALPQKLRVQITHIITDTIGKPRFDGFVDPVEGSYGYLHRTLCREYGLFQLTGEPDQSDFEKFLNFFLSTKDVDKALDVIEISFRFISNEFHPTNHDISHVPSDMATTAIEELNERFKENGVGYAFVEGEIIRIDSTFMHSEVIMPSIRLTSNKSFKGANEEYLKAHDHYKNGRNKECLTECLKATESAIKSICVKKKWKFNENDSIKKLIQVVFTNDLVPQHNQQQFNSLRNLLESGVPAIRNRHGAHGQGVEVVPVNNEITRYALNLTGANILFLIDQAKL